MPPHHSGGGTASFSNFSKADSGAGFLLSAAIFYLIAIASYYHFLGSDYFLLTKSAWTTDAGYTKLNFVYFVLGTYFLPAGILFTLIFISKSSKYLPSRSYGKLLIYVFLLATFIVGCITSANNCSDVLNCIGIFCIGTSGISSRSSGVISFNLALFFIAIFFSIIFASLSLIEGFILYRMRLQPEQYSSLNVVEKSPLADSDLKVITNFNSGMRKCVKAVRSAERAHRRKYMRAWLSEALLMTLVFLVLYPILILASTLLPTWWSGFTRYKIQQYQLSVPSQAYGLYWSLTFQNKLVLKLYPDIVIYYGAIYIVSFLALLAQYWLPLRLFFHKRLTSTVCVGQVLLGSGLVALLLGEWCYWFFGHSWENNLVKPRSNAELAARSFGQVGNVVLGLLVLPVAKSGVWSKLFGVSWEGMIVYHQLLGYAFLLIILFHMLSWWYVFALKGSFPSDIFSVPMTYHKDNFTVPLSVLTSLVMFIIMGGLTFNLIRRKCYELFYYFHLFSGVIFLSVLWHATMSWYYITAGLFLYALDNAVRLSTTVATLVTVDQLVVELRDIDDNSPAITSSSTNILSVNNLSVETATAGVVKLAYTVASPLMSAGERGPLNHLMGQYVYINIPAISSLEWHPFTISSAPIDHVTTHHIKVMGGLKGNQWTAKLYQLVKSLESAVAGDEEENSLSRRYYHGSAEEKSISHVGHRDANDVSSCLFPISSPFSKLLVNIDGPYGLSVSHELHRYTHLLLVGGGIGVTPLHSCLRHLLLSDACAVTSHKQGAPRNEGLLSKPYPKLEQVRLLWSVKSEEEANLFKSTLDLIASDDQIKKFSMAVHLTSKQRLTQNRDMKSQLRKGRPDLSMEIARLSHHKHRLLVFVCGPKSMVEECSLLTMQHGVDFRHETFEL